jgi:hypothetical protein
MARHPSPKTFADSSPPPRIWPDTNPTPIVTPNQEMARARSEAGNVAVIRASTCGTITAPVSPCTSRAATSSPGDWARPHSSDATANVITPIMNIRRYPNRSPSRPPVTMPAAYMNA